MSVSISRRRPRAVALPRELTLVVGVTALAAIARFVALGTQSYWYDEGQTVLLVSHPFGRMLHAVVNGQAESPPFFILAWLWSHAFGFTEVGVRSLSAVLGTLTVPVAYLAAKILVGRRAALAVALMAALSPALIWYSQEARAYSLMTFLCALSLLYFLRARERPARRDLGLWALVSALAVVSHYFSAFLVGPEALWLLLRSSARRDARIAVGALALAGVAIAPLALHQRAHGGTSWIGQSPIAGRFEGMIRFFAVGPSGPVHGHLVTLGASLLFLVALGLALLRAESRVRDGALMALGLGGAVIVLPLLAGAVGSDYFLDRNVLGAWVPLAIAAAAGFMNGRAGRLGAAMVVGVCVVFAVIDARVPGNAAVQRDDWRGVARVLGAPRETRAIEVSPGWQASTLVLYVPRLAPLRAARVKEFVTIEYHGVQAWRSPIRLLTPGAPFRRVQTVVQQHMTVTRYEAPTPVSLSARPLTGAGLNASLPFVQTAR